MPTLDKFSIDNRSKLDNFSIDRFKLDAFMVDGLSIGTPGIDSYTKAMLHFNGINGSTTFTDEIGKIWTPHSSAQLSIISPIFGNASGLFTINTADYIDTPDHADFDVGNGDFTIDFDFKRGTTGTTQFICGQTDAAFLDTNTSFGFDFSTINRLRGWVYSGSTLYAALNTVAITDSNKHHVALIRNGTNLSLYIDGISVASVNIGTNSVNNSSGKFSIGRLGEYNSSYYDGRIDEFRFSKTARWTTNFTPPTSEYI